MELPLELSVWSPVVNTYTVHLRTHSGIVITVGLSRLLKERGLSLRELARRTSTHPDVLSRFARGATSGVSYDLLERVCRELPCQPGDLLHYEPDNEQISFLKE